MRNINLSLKSTACFARKYASWYSEENALLHANPRITGEWHALLDLTVLVSEPNYHSNVHTQSSHVQQGEYDQCGDEHQ